MSAAPTSAARPGPRLHADERRVEVIEAAVHAFAEGGLAGTSTEEIARLAGVSQPYVFRLFGSKHQLFLAAVGRGFERVRLTFEEAARHPIETDGSFDPILAAIGHAYGRLLMTDQALLRLQLHAYAACNDPVIRDFVRAEFAGLITAVSEVSGVPASALRPFFAEGMLMNVAATLDLSRADVAWDDMCEGRAAPA
jgi:AcrR family transcriptional regulator